MSQPELQLEYWQPKGRKGGSWIVAAPDTHLFTLRSWRKVKPGHTHKDKLPHSIAAVRGGYSRDAFEVCQAYCAWARTRLCRVSVFKGDYRSTRAALEAGLERSEVDPAEFIGPAPVAEILP